MDHEKSRNARTFYLNLIWIRQNHWNTIAERNGTTAARVSRNLSITEEMYHKGKPREILSFLSFFLSFDSSNQKRDTQQRFDSPSLDEEKIEKLYLRNASFRNSRNVPNGFWKSSKNAPRAFHLFILFLLFITPRIPRTNAEETRENRNRGTAAISRFVLPIVGKRETDKTDRLEETRPIHYIALWNCCDSLLYRESLPPEGEEEICPREEEESSIAFPQCSKRQIYLASYQIYAPNNPWCDARWG